jgi:hypothetical protein
MSAKAMKQVQHNQEVFTKDFAREPDPSTYEILNHQPDCGGGENDAKLWSIILTIVTAFVAAWSVWGFAA